VAAGAPVIDQQALQAAQQAAQLAWQQRVSGAPQVRRTPTLTRRPVEQATAWAARTCIANAPSKGKLEQRGVRSISVNRCAIIDQSQAPAVSGYGGSYDTQYGGQQPQQYQQVQYQQPQNQYQQVQDPYQQPAYQQPQYDAQAQYGPPQHSGQQSSYGPPPVDPYAAQPAYGQPQGYAPAAAQAYQVSFTQTLNPQLKPNPINPGLLRVFCDCGPNSATSSCGDAHSELCPAPRVAAVVSQPPPASGPEPPPAVWTGALRRDARVAATAGRRAAAAAASTRQRLPGAQQLRAAAGGRLRGAASRRLRGAAGKRRHVQRCAAKWHSAVSVRWKPSCTGVPEHAGALTPSYTGCAAHIAIDSLEIRLRPAGEQGRLA
jgi:hypothetical protein